MVSRKDSKNRKLRSGEYERPNGTYEYRYKTKTKKSKVIYAKTLIELREEEEKILKNSLNGIAESDSKLTLNDWADRWFRNKRGLKDNTLHNYKYLYETYVRNEIGRIRIQEIRRSDVREFYNTLYDVRYLRPNTIGSVQTVLVQVFEMALNDDMIIANPCLNALKDLTRAHSKDKIEKFALTVKQEETLLKYLRDEPKYHAWYPIVATLLFTGMRIGECTGLQHSDIDSGKEYIDVNKTLVFYCNRTDKETHGNCVYNMNTPKTEAGTRKIPMIPYVEELLKLQQAMYEEKGLYCIKEVDGYNDFVFVNRFGEVYNQGTVNKAIKKIVRDCNYELIDSGREKDLLPNISCHILRHTFATRMEDMNISKVVRQYVLGHHAQDMTDGTYTHPSFERCTSEMEKMNALVESLLS